MLTVPRLCPRRFLTPELLSRRWRLICAILASAVLGCDSARTEGRPDDAIVVLHASASINVGSDGSVPTVSDAAILGDEIAVMRSGHIEFRDAMGSITSSAPIPADLLVYDPQLWKVTAGERLLYLSHPEFDSIVEFDRYKGEFRAFAVDGLLQIDDVAVGENSAIYAVGVGSDSGLHVVRVHQVSDEVIVSQPLLPEAPLSHFGSRVEIAGDTLVLVSLAFPRKLIALTPDLQVVDESVADPTWVEDELFAWRSSRDFVVENAIARGVLTFGAMFGDRHILIEALPKTRRRVTVMTSDTTRETIVDGAFNIVDADPASCQLLMLDWTREGEYIHVMNVRFRESEVCAGGASNSITLPEV